MGIVVGALQLDPLAVWKPERQFPDKTSINVLILGVDYDWSNQGGILRKARARSDSILVARIDFARKTISALTIPRDTAVNIPGRRGIHKINAAHAFGGPELAQETIKQVFDIPTDAYVVLNVEGFQKIVDAVGGIDITVRKKLDYDDNWGHLHVHLKPGYQHMNGYQAMGYVRVRHSDSDLMRSQRQHEFIEAMRSKIKSPASFGKLPGLVDKLDEQLHRGQLTADQLISMVNFARTLPKENINVETLPSIEGPSYVTVNTEKSVDVIQKLFFPDRIVALNIDTPDPDSVRSMNARYGRGGRRGRSKKSEKHQLEKKPTTPEGGLSVEPGATESGIPPEVNPVPEPLTPAPTPDGTGGNG